jgi:hypothetical protein
MELMTMNHPVLSLWPQLLWECCYLLFFVGLGLLLPALGLILCLIFKPWRGRAWPWRLLKHVRRFRTVGNERVLVHYSPDLADRWNLTLLMQRFQEEVDFLTGEFGFPPRRRVAVYLLSDCRPMVTIFAPGYHGVALGRANAIVVPDDYSLWETVRHELAHLFAYRWRGGAPTQLAEGIAVWMQSKKWTTSIHTEARKVCGESVPPVCQLLDHAGFFAEPHCESSYVVAGSFTGFLIARYGWARYQQLYSRSSVDRFKRTFERCCGESMETAEALWKRWALRKAVPVN